MGSRAAFWVWVVAWGLVAVATLTPVPVIDFVAPILSYDKLLHVVIGAFLALSAWPLARAWWAGAAARAWRVVAAACAYGAAIEGLQALVPGRSCELWDWIADAVGAVAAAAWLAAREVRAARRA